MALPQGNLVVTPEAVALELDIAGLPSRLLARAIDSLIVGVVLATLIGGTLAANLGGGVSLAVVYVLLFFGFFGYWAAFETLWRGRTPGKAALGLRVITVEGAPIRFRHAAIRAAFGLGEVYATNGAIGILAIIFSRRSQRLGDMVAGTIVLRERSGL